jgi:hypothetical protein
MDSGIAAVLGALIGVLSAPLSTWFSEYWRDRRSDKIDSLRRARLRKLLTRFTWRKIEYLSEAIGATDEKTTQLLLEIDARKSLTKGSTYWALVSKAPFPEDAAADKDATTT